MSRLVAGNALTLLETGQEYFPALLREIERAAEEIFLETYLFENDAIGRRVAAALGCAALRGVRVHVLVDGFGGRAFVHELMPQMEGDGVQVLIYRPEMRALSLRRHRLRRMHRKLAVVDGRVAFVGGINIVNDFEVGGPPHPRHDYAVRAEGPVVAHMLAAAHHLWHLVSWASLSRRLNEPLRAPARVERAGRLRAAFLIRDNLRHRRDIENAYLAAIGHAREEVLIACAYFFPGRRFRRALIEAARRGVRVTLLLQGLVDHPVLAHASRALYPYFHGHGIRLFEYHRSYLHAKVAVVDRRWATVGSSNIDPFSLLLAREANMVVVDKDFAGTLHDSVMRAVEQGARELAPASWWKQGLLRRAASWLAYQFVRLAIGVAGFGRKR